MRGRLPPLSGREVIVALEKAGYIIVRQRGSHIRMRCLGDTARRPVTVPAHREVKPDLLRKIIRDADLTVEEFMELLRG
ncbi:MAG: type II toxin-antitoxin system HicA family toxin [Chloroflexi bacterium]|nr:type II toxin-antitoxin system HicA family toxin [Chloroflexota bacterium]